MSRFGSLVCVGAGCIALALGCGEKDLPSDPYATDGVSATGGVTSTGGTSVIPDGDAGAPNTVDSGEAVPTGPVYTNDIELFLQKYCTVCHSATAGVSPSMDMFATAKDSAVASNKTLDEGTMPTGSKKPTAAEKARFADWIKAGFPQ